MTPKAETLHLMKQIIACIMQHNTTIAILMMRRMIELNRGDSLITTYADMMQAIEELQASTTEIEVQANE